MCHFVLCGCSFDTAVYRKNSRAWKYARGRNTGDIACGNPACSDGGGIAYRGAAEQHGVCAAGISSPGSNGTAVWLWNRVFWQQGFYADTAVYKREPGGSRCCSGAWGSACHISAYVVWNRVCLQRLWYSGTSVGHTGDANQPGVCFNPVSYSSNVFLGEGDTNIFCQQLYGNGCGMSGLWGKISWDAVYIWYGTHKVSEEYRKIVRGIYRLRSDSADESGEQGNISPDFWQVQYRFAGTDFMVCMENPKKQEADRMMVWGYIKNRKKLLLTAVVLSAIIGVLCQVFSWQVANAVYKKDAEMLSVDCLIEEQKALQEAIEKTKRADTEVSFLEEMESYSETLQSYIDRWQRGEIWGTNWYNAVELLSSDVYMWFNQYIDIPVWPGNRLEILPGGWGMDFRNNLSQEMQNPYLVWSVYLIVPVQMMVLFGLGFSRRTKEGRELLSQIPIGRRKRCALDYLLLQTVTMGVHGITLVLGSVFYLKEGIRMTELWVAWGYALLNVLVFSAVIYTVMYFFANPLAGFFMGMFLYYVWRADNLFDIMNKVTEREASQEMWRLVHSPWMVLAVTVIALLLCIWFAGKKTLPERQVVEWCIAEVLCIVSLGMEVFEIMCEMGVTGVGSAGAIAVCVMIFTTILFHLHGVSQFVEKCLDAG